MTEIIENKLERPTEIPEKFWNSETGEIRMDALIKSYTELEKKLGCSHLIPKENLTEDDLKKIESIRGVPESVEGYNDMFEEGGIQADIDVNEKLLAAGFTKDQVKLVYDLASEKLSPLAQKMKQELQEKTELQKLHTYFGSEERFNEIAHQVLAFGRKKMTENSLDVVCQNADGIISLYEMMQSTEPKIIKDGIGGTEDLTEDNLKKMMANPKYWRDQDPEYTDKIRQGFEKIYAKEND